MNKLRALRKTNRQLSKKLDYINKPIYLDISTYLLGSRLYIEKIEETKQDILYIMLEAQDQGVSFDTKLGVSVKNFCDEIIQSSVKKTIFESILEFIRMIAIFSFILFMGILLPLPSNLNNYNMLFSGHSVILQIPLSVVTYAISYSFIVFFVNVYIIRLLLIILHTHRHTRILTGVISLFIYFIFTIISFLFFDQNITFTIQMMHALTIFIVSVLAMAITSLWIFYLRKQHIELTIMQQ
ncbi:hypothetical protein ACWG0P_00540 [Amedibacillus sp. YH-ame6]